MGMDPLVCDTTPTHRNCSTGEGRFQFVTPQSRLIHAKVHTVAVAKATVQRKGSQVRRGVAWSVRGGRMEDCVCVGGGGRMEDCVCVCVGR